MRLEIEQAINNSLLICDYSGLDISSFEKTLAKSAFLRNDESKKQIVILLDNDVALNSECFGDISLRIKIAGFNYLVGIGGRFINNVSSFTIENDVYDSADEFLSKLDKDQFKNSNILIKGAKSNGLEEIVNSFQLKLGKTVFEIDLDAMKYNLNQFRSFLKPTTKTMVMVKALSYGTGTVEVAKFLQSEKVGYLGVAITDEGVLLRKSGVYAPIAVMNPEQSSFRNIVEYNLEPCIYSLPLLISFIQVAKLHKSTKFRIHIKLDTGMNRLGFKSREELLEAATVILETDNIKVLSVFSHLSGSDEAIFDDFTKEQFSRFSELAELFMSQFNYRIERHILNSAGIERFSDFQFDMVRLGIGLYGITRADLKLKSIGTLKTTISLIKEVFENETIGYSRKGKISKVSKIATIPIGYGDGYFRILGNKNARVFINGSYAPIIGNVCMDMCMVDVSGIDVSLGDHVELFGVHVTISELAENAGTIPYEILTNVSQRVKRTYVLEC